MNCCICQNDVIPNPQSWDFGDSGFVCSDGCMKVWIAVPKFEGCNPKTLHREVMRIIADGREYPNRWWRGGSYPKFLPAKYKKRLPPKVQKEKSVLE